MKGADPRRYVWCFTEEPRHNLIEHFDTSTTAVAVGKSATPGQTVMKEPRSPPTEVLCLTRNRSVNNVCGDEEGLEKHLEAGLGQLVERGGRRHAVQGGIGDTASIPLAFSQLLAGKISLIAALSKLPFWRVSVTRAASSPPR